MTHIETLRFELEAAKQVLVSQIYCRDSYRRYVMNALNRGDMVNYRAFGATLREYEEDTIPRTERMIAALDYILRRYEELTDG